MIIITTLILSRVGENYRPYRRRTMRSRSRFTATSYR